ncbi:rieske domain protein [Mycobacterium xenopi 4042]|uniref:Rieske domain protein n=1 Tax=Mycobacterium xenopi 4042 TaxID=1299334 RepID=X8E5G5_MYCXE|nr:rieske domain protein [Mycobacterium xenopi 4042]
MDRDQLIDLTRRALKLARDKTTDLAPTEQTVDAGTTPRLSDTNARGQC